nr:MAG TPA: hypothetical protein [Caudoviricetes sp.]
MSVFAPTYSSPTQPILSCRNVPAGSPPRLAHESEWRALWCVAQCRAEMLSVASQTAAAESTPNPMGLSHRNRTPQGRFPINLRIRILRAAFTLNVRKKTLSVALAVHSK